MVQILIPQHKDMYIYMYIHMSVYIYICINTYGKWKIKWRKWNMKRRLGLCCGLTRVQDNMGMRSLKAYHIRSRVQGLYRM